MAMLKQSVVDSAKRLLELNREFCLQDFTLNIPENSNTLMRIEFRALPEYVFIIDEHIPRSRAVAQIVDHNIDDQKVIRTLETPGDYKTTDVNIHKKIDEAISRIAAWTDNIREGLVFRKNTVEPDDADKFYDDLYSNLEEKLEDPEAYFDDSEKEVLKSQLETLEKRVAELEKQLTISEQDSRQVKSVIEKGKNDLDVYPKGVWYKTAVTKIYSTLKKAVTTQEGRQYLFEFAKLFIESKK